MALSFEQFKQMRNEARMVDQAAQQAGYIRVPGKGYIRNQNFLDPQQSLNFGQDLQEFPLDLRNKELRNRQLELEVNPDYEQLRRVEEIKAQASAEAAAKYPKEGKTTDDQRKVSGYAQRLQQSNAIFDELDPILAPYNPITYFIERNILPNPAKSEPIQRQEQAERNFLNAVLRRESGAVISPTEFKEGIKQYFPRPGDKPQVLKQKKANRLLVQQNFINESGNAFKERQQPNTVGRFQVEVAQ